MIVLPSFPRFECDILVIVDPKGEDQILGFAFLNQFHSSIDWRQGLITYNLGYKDSSDSLIPLSNKFSTSTNCESLVGDSRTPSFPTSVHITSINSPE
ncbi:hypothetical protein O181_072593 [Austropuccinia psidii MF-1]|uniref:Uncharacterized protein n=1 Tax=Austropuccinia psidii MF-1 TaxID=1389203 RepID=A0A9Q3F3A2_9BASI|nr:hypothetical protein [Austropuccinia psidii MF-1]